MRENLLDIRDYFNMRDMVAPSVVKWKQVRSMLLPNGKILWQMFGELEDYNPEYQPDLDQLKIIKQKLEL